MSLCELVVGGKNGLDGFERSVIDRAVQTVYREYLADPQPEKMPILEDLYNILCGYDEPEAKRVAIALELYVHGSLNVFNHRTNVDLNNRLVCFDIKELGKQLKKLGMLVLQDQVWGRVTTNRAARKTTWFYQGMKRFRTNTIPKSLKALGRLVHVVLKTEGFPELESNN